MRIEKSVTSISWLPSETVAGVLALPFELGITHYDAPPPDAIGDIEEMGARGAFRFANQLRAFIEVEGGAVTGFGHLGSGMVSGSEVRFGPAKFRFAPVMLPVRRAEPTAEGDGIRFTQTVGGRTSMPSPRRVAGSALIRLDAPLVWTTLSLTIHPDGSHRHELVGASGIPRHWVYDDGGHLVEKSAVMEFKDWIALGDADTPWGGTDSRILTAEVESALERRLSRLVMAKKSGVERRSLREGEVLVRQGDTGTDLYLLLDGLLTVEVDGEDLADVGPGAILGEHAVLGDGRRTATLRAATRARLAVIPGSSLDPADLASLGLEHRREVGPPSS